MNEGMENLKEIEALKQQIHMDREAHQKEIALVREDAQIEILTKDKQITELQNRLYSAEEVNQAHQKLNGELQTKLSKYEDKAAHYRRKGVL